jgi:hypothetical protein
MSCLGKPSAAAWFFTVSCSSDFTRIIWQIRRLASPNRKCPRLPVPTAARRSCGGDHFQLKPLDILLHGLLAFLTLILAQVPIAIRVHGREHSVRAILMLGSRELAIAISVKHLDFFGRSFVVLIRLLATECGRRLHFGCSYNTVMISVTREEHLSGRCSVFATRNFTIAVHVHHFEPPVTVMTGERSWQHAERKTAGDKERGGTFSSVHDFSGLKVSKRSVGLYWVVPSHALVPRGKPEASIRKN